MEEMAGVRVSDELFELFGLVNSGNKGAKNALQALAKIVREFRGRFNDLLIKRNDLQARIDGFLDENKDICTSSFTNKLREIGYITENSAGHEIKISHAGLPEEIAVMAGPQLVVPADKANMVLNAANARWGSLYNALYTSNVIDPAITADSPRKAAVMEYTCNFLDGVVQFDGSVKWSDIKEISINTTSLPYQLIAKTSNGREATLNIQGRQKLVAFSNNSNSFILENNGLKIQVKLTPEGALDEVFLESAVTYIIDLEDASISAPVNKMASYYNIYGIVNGTLTCQIEKAGNISTRAIAKDEDSYINAATGRKISLKRTALPLVRDVGMHMIADKALIEIDGQPVFEKILDCFITSMLGMRFHVAPKMHGAEEVALNVDLWDAINSAQNLPKDANKIGIMVEEMRTSAQLKDAIAAAKNITFFTNTGFLDYTGSYIDLMMCCGAIAPFSSLANEIYKVSYEKYNVDVSLRAGVSQIGAGMWPQTRNMAGLLPSKRAQIEGCTDTSWSPAPLAATIHALAFHGLNARQMQQNALVELQKNGVGDDVPDDLFVFPKINPEITKEKILNELELAIHGLLAYAEPWVRRGIGCSSIKDRNNIDLMEDRATARIKAAFVRNWLLHAVITRAEVVETISKMCDEINLQNKNTNGYKPLSKNLDGEQVVVAVSDAIFNPLKRKDSYIEPYFYPAYQREQEVRGRK
jgi:malate synthase